MRCCFLLFPALFLLAACSPTMPGRFTLPAGIPEVSGLYIDTRDTVFWWHNDSGHGPLLYQTDARGQLLDTVRLPVPSKDWEDITAAPDGRIFIGDFGNNCHCRDDLRIYLYNRHSGQVDSILFRYPDFPGQQPPLPQRNFDMEGFFFFQDSLHLFAKGALRGKNYTTKHYVLPASPGQYLAELRDTLVLPRRVVTAAAISPDGQQVALLAYRFRFILKVFPSSAANVFVLSDYPGTHFLRGEVRKVRFWPYLIPTQYEALDYWDEHTVYIASERTPLRKAHARRLGIK